ncbi:fumarylacetoacetate (FAA) hydrolase [Natronospira proteinivora]|uniref:Fumarylacetoacetate (FAA) hydrolase n=1 Tax=Natronospira proteinivora TaxID=1807133 RepID=A0ABT1G887_9GAMM|nr:fumarylacetoacetate hydrolase family protein [Natronospira proteinivora]MCP1727517.1 fumarylacetoacetate (FAA) hydrolase [Natronospira proteinivora]
MKLGSLKKGRDGELIIVSRDLKQAVRAGDIAPTLQLALENWASVEPKLRALSEKLEAGEAEGSFAFKQDEVDAVLPRNFQFLDGSAYLPHVERVRKARGAELPPQLLDDPLMYQAVCDGYDSPRDPIRMASEEYGIDFESEVGVITDDVPMGVSEEEAGKHIKLLLILNDVSLRKLIPSELGKGFGFIHGKPRSALSPVAVTPDELGSAWQDYKIQLPLVTHYKGELFGRPNCGVDMQFSFARLVSHAAKTRPLSAGTLVGSGTIANRDESLGSSCLAEKNVLEVINGGEAKTGFMKFGDTVKIEMLDDQDNSIFGSIEQTVEQYK